MYLFIDTSKDKTIVQILDKHLKIIDSCSRDGQKNQSENLLGLIDKILKKTGYDKSDISGIFVVSGPGSYTGLRVGVATANALSLALGVKVSGVKERPSHSNIIELEDSDNKVVPFYSYPPKITKNKSRL